jgi:hypothetical protein
MSSTTSTTQALTPRQADALRLWKAMPEGERSYQALAQRMGGITHGRAGVYLREAIAITGEADLLPRKGNGGGATGPRKKATDVASPDSALETLIGQYDDQINGLEARVHEAREAASNFDPAKWIEEEAARLDEAAKNARERAQAFKKNAENVATQAAEQEGKRRAERVETVEADSMEAIEKARAAKDALMPALEALKAAQA